MNKNNNEIDISIIINNSTNNLMLNNYLNMKKIINDVNEYIQLNDHDNNKNQLSDEIIINLIKEYRNNLLLDCYNKNNKFKIIKTEEDKQLLKEHFEWFYNYDYNNFSSALIQEKGNIKSFNRLLNHYNDEGKFIYNQKPYYYYSALRLDNNNKFMDDLYKLYLLKYKKELQSY